MRHGLAPIARAARMNSRSLSESTWPRTRRATPIHDENPRTATSAASDGRNTAARKSSRNSIGTASSASTIRIRTRVHDPAGPPGGQPGADAERQRHQPGPGRRPPSDTRAPESSRASTSRPTVSVPSQKRRVATLAISSAGHRLHGAAARDDPVGSPSACADSPASVVPSWRTRTTRVAPGREQRGGRGRPRSRSGRRRTTARHTAARARSASRRRRRAGAAASGRRPRTAAHRRTRGSARA